MKKFMHILLFITMLSSVVLLSSTVSADDSVVDDVNITVPVSCTMSGTGQNSHNANINNGLYVPDIGTTTLHAFCNDNEGFAIYAAGYTGNEVGGTNSNKLVGTTTSGNATIDTGLATTAGTPDISNWAMKLTITQDSGDTTGTNAFTIDSDTEGPFSTYHTVPNAYTKVAHKTAATNMTASTGGVKLTTTYAAYISKNQSADTYSGQVIYTLVHPAAAPAPGPKSLDTATTMQEVTYCSDTLSEGQVYTLTDSRDGNIYHVARLADGNCWMLDNLALDPTDSITAQNMNETNTNATAEAINNLLHGGSTNTGWSNIAVADVDTGFYSYTNPMINNASKDTLVTSYGPASINGQAKVGIYYNFCAASAGTYCYVGDQGVDVPDTIIDASQDLCPTNWRMPTGGDTGEYFALAQEYSSDATNSNSLQQNLSTPLSGTYYNGSRYYQGGGGFWWSSTYYDSNDMHFLNVFPSNVYSYGGSSRYESAHSMRCLMPK